MPRTLKRVAHDLLPLSDAVTELGELISQLLEAVKSHANFDDPRASKYFEECTQAAQNLALSSKLIRQYVLEIDLEADREGIMKN